jgi:hypothetical protein
MYSYVYRKAINPAIDQPEVIEASVNDDGTDETIRELLKIQSSNLCQAFNMNME